MPLPKKKLRVKKLRASIKKDPIQAKDLLAMKFLSACEDCIHFHRQEGFCTIGYVAEPHRRETQLKSYDISGTMALCRFMEID
ncbi:MAG: hypothetical protein WCH11_03875 [Bdellovibrio sp.]